MKTRILIFSTLAALFMAACEKDDNNNQAPLEDTEAPVITIIEPDTSTHVMGGMAMPIKVQVTDNDEVHEIHLNVVNTTNGNDSIMMHVHQHSHGKTAMMDTSFVVPMKHHQDYEIRVRASDHSMNESNKTVHRHVHM